MRQALPCVLILFLAFLEAVPPAHSQPGDPPVSMPLFEFTDPTNDVFARIDVVPPTQVPPNAQSAAADLVAFRVVSEDQHRLAFELEFVDVSTWWQTRSFLSGVADYEIRFTLRAAAGDVHYRLSSRLHSGEPSPQGVPAGPIRIEATLYIQAGADEYEAVSQPASGSFYPAANRVAFSVPKLSILGGYPRTETWRKQTLPTAIPPSLDIGAVLRFDGLRASIGSFYDTAPNDGEIGEFATQQPTANTRIKLRPDRIYERPPEDYYGRAPDPNATRVAVLPGTAFAIPIRVENHVLAKRLVNLTVTFKDAAQAGRWSAQIAPTVEVKANDSRVVNLIVNASATTPHRSEAQVLISAQSLAYVNEVSTMQIGLVAADLPRVGKDRLHFHKEKTEGSSTARWLNTLANDPGATGDDEPHTFSSYMPSLELDTTLSKDLSLDPAGVIQGTVVMSAGSTIQPTFTFRVFIGRQFLGEAIFQHEVGTSPTRIEFAIPMDPRNARIPFDQGKPRFEGSLRDETPAYLFQATYLQNKLHFRESFLDLPIVPDPSDSVDVRPRLVSLVPKNGTDDFLNPGRTALFYVVLANEGPQTDQAWIEVAPDRPDWEVTIRPAERFNLDPGQSATIAVFVRARPGALEGEQLRAHLAAHSTIDPRSESKLILVATATAGADIPDEADAYRADPDALEKVVRPPRESPGPAALLVLAVLWIAGRLRRET